RLLFVAVFTFTGMIAGVPKDALPEVVSRMDEAAAKFQAMTATVSFITHTDVINENLIESANLAMKRTGANSVQALIDFTEPASSRKTVSFSGRKAQIYYPKIKTVQIYDFGKGGDQLDQFIMLGFGTSGSELAKSYGMRVLGSETLNGQPVIKLELTP